MSFVAKVFVVFNLLLSALFLYFAMYTWTARTKWQKMYEAEKAGNVVGVAELQKFQLRLAQSEMKAEQAAAAMKSQLGNEKRAKEELRDQILAAQTELNKIKNEIELAQAERQEVSREKDRVVGELLKARSVIMKEQQALEVERSNATRYKNEKSEMEVSFNQQSATLSQTTRDLHRVEQDLALANSRIQKVIEGGGTLDMGDDDVAMPALEGQVLAANPSVGLVMISLGSQNGVKPGFKLTLSRGTDYIGKVQVDKVYPDMCSAKIIGALMNKSNLEIQVHDVAKTR